VKADKLLNKTKWTGTALMVFGTLLNSLGIYPWGPVVMVTSGILWSIVSIAWGDRALIVTNITVTSVGACGLLFRVIERVV